MLSWSVNCLVEASSTEQFSSCWEGPWHDRSIPPSHLQIWILPLRPVPCKRPFLFASYRVPRQGLQFIRIFHYQRFCCVATELNQNGPWYLIIDSFPTKSEDFTYIFLCHSRIQPKQKLHAETFVCNIPFSCCVHVTFWDSVKKTILLRRDSLSCSSHTASLESCIVFCTDSTSEDTSPSFLWRVYPQPLPKNFLNLHHHPLKICCLVVYNLQDKVCNSQFHSICHTSTASCSKNWLRFYETTKWNVK